jgi:glucose-6-phosphate isomerase
MTFFHHLPSVAQLHDLAQDSIDLTKEGVLTAKRIDSMMIEALGLKLFYATEKVSEKNIAVLCQLAEETQAVKKMIDMQNGKVVNFIKGFPNENRPAMHTAVRDFFEQCNTSSEAKQATELGYKELEKLRSFLDTIEKKSQITTVIQIGIGGSDLGPEAIYLALEAFHKLDRKVYFLSNIDPDEGARIFQQVDLEKTLVVVSKSGTTLETMTNERFARDKFKQAGLTTKHHFVSVTGKGSPMDNKEQYMDCFYIWDYIGGRYSVTSMVGAFILAFALGMDRFLDFLKGANAMDKVALRSDPYTNLPLMSALLGIWNHNFLGFPNVAVIPYSQALSRFPAHLQQLDMESNGKSIDKEGHFVEYDTGPIIWGESGTNSQHSFFQSIHQGTTVVPIEFIGFKESQYKEDIFYQQTTSQEKLLANLFAQSIALAVGQKSDNPNTFFSGNRPNRILLADKLDPFTMGTILAFYEHKVVFQGFIWNINSFDQEGVQLGKNLASKILEQFSLQRQGRSADAKGFPLGVAYLEHLSFGS